VKRAFASIDGEPENPAFPCYVDERDTWNGWNKPWFTPAVCREVITRFEATALFEGASSFGYFDAADGDKPYFFPSMVIDGVTHHQLAGGIYCWSVIDVNSIGER
jgi:hypothetical protein